MSGLFRIPLRHLEFLFLIKTLAASSIDVNQERHTATCPTKASALVQTKSSLSQQRAPDTFCQGKQGLFAAPSDPLDNDDCRGYYNCFHGTEPVQLCAAGQRFNPDTKNCDWATNVACLEQPPTASPTPSSTTVSTTSSLQSDGTFEFVDGGIDKACRGSSSDDNSNSYYTLMRLDADECKHRCVETVGCQGIEFNGNRCEIWTRPNGIGASKHVSGFTCLRYVPKGFTTTSTTFIARAGSFEPVDGGSDRACRGANRNDNIESYYIVRRLHAVACKEECTKMLGCQGIEFKGTRCEIWMRPDGIGASADVRGFTCLRFLPEVSSTTIPQPSSHHVFVGYFANWFQWHADPYKFLPSHIQADKITHLNYAFALIHSSTFEIRHFEDNDVSNWGTGNWQVPCSKQGGSCQKGLYEQVNDVKIQHGHLKTLISLGGWSFSLPESEDPESARRMKRLDSGWTEFVFSDMVSSAMNRKKFVASSIRFCRTWGFDGLDLDWEYPGHLAHGGRATDKTNFAILLSELRSAFDQESGETGKPALLLTAAVGIGPSVVENGYDIPALNRHLDFINLMTYDMYGGWNPERVGIHSQLHAGPGDAFGSDAVPLSAEWAVDYWISQGADARKLAIGLASYSRSYKLKTSEAGQQPGAAAVGYGASQPYSKQLGLASYYEILNLVAAGAEKTYDASRCAAFLQKEDLWMGFDDEESLRCKARFVKDRGLRGGLLWDLPEDDFLNGSPLVSAFSDALGVFEERMHSEA